MPLTWDLEDIVSFGQQVKVSGTSSWLVSCKRCNAVLKFSHHNDRQASDDRQQNLL